MTDEPTPDDYRGKGEDGNGLSIQVSEYGKPKLRVYVGTYWTTFDDPEEIDAALAAFEEAAEEFKKVEG